MVCLCYLLFAKRAVFVKAEQSSQAAQSEFTSQGHYLARWVNGLGASLRTFEGAVATPDTMFAVGQTQKVFHSGRIIGLVPGLINRGQSSWSNKFIIGCHSWTGAHADTALDALLETVESRKVVREFDCLWKYTSDCKSVDG